MKTILFSAGLTLSLGVFSLTACGSSQNCAAGYENCPCTAEKTCNAGLVCEERATNLSICANPNDGTGGSSSGTGGESTGSGGGNNGDGGTVGSGGTVTGIGGSVGTGGSIGNTGGSQSTCVEGSTQGSCSTTNALDCYLGEWVQNESCAACSVVSPSSACDRVAAFMLDYSYSPAPGLVSESYTASGASATFEPAYSDDIGYLQFRLPYAISLNSVAISVSATSGTVSASLEVGDNGASGCNFVVSGGYLSLAETGCWGTATTSSAFNVLNVRVSNTISPVTLTVSSVAFL